MKSGANGHWDGTRRVPLRVLLVEDDRADARLTTALVTGGRDGVEVTHVLTLAEAFELRHLEFRNHHGFTAELGVCRSAADRPDC